jgi:predicted O-methyltransferase YrrM
MFLGFEYIKYRWNAKRRHGVHSPFIYELTDKCFRTPSSALFTERMNFLKSKLKRNNSTIEITDYGAGSRRMGNTRKLGTIYRTNTSKGKFGKTLFQLMQFYQLETALELGTSLGIGSVCMATGNEKAAITTIEGCPNINTIANENFQALEIDNINSLKGTFSSVIPSLPKLKYDLIFIDGHHDGEALLNYVEELLPHAHDDTFFLLDDIRWSASMKSAWEQLKADERFHVSIDLFRMGMILLRSKQEKEHFDILL